MAASATRSRLIQAAVDLFSVKGYDGTSVDEIAGAVGIKGPNLYKYFKSKEALFQEVARLADEEYSRGMSLGRDQAESIRSGEELKAFSMRQISFTLSSENVVKMRRVFTMEQYRSGSFAARASEHQITTMQCFYAGVFRGMMASGQMAQGDAGLLALEYIAPAALLIQMCDREPGRKKEALEAIEKHIDFFIGTYCGAQAAPAASAPPESGKGSENDE